MHIASFASRHFISHSFKRNLLIVVGSLFNVDFDHLALGLRFGGVSLPLTTAASSLHLSEHTRAYLTDLHDNTLSIASGALFAVADNDLSVNRQLDRLSVVEIFQGDFNRVLNAGTFARARSTSSSATSSEKHAEQVFTSSSPGSAILFNTFQPILVVEFALLWIAENFVCGINLLEVVLVPSLIRVVFDTETLLTVNATREILGDHHRIPCFRGSVLYSR
jgi:hypothetical protein